MRAEENRRTFLFELHDAVKRLARKSAVTHRQGFINDQYVRVYIGSNGKRQTNIHAARIRFDRLINKLPDIGK